MLKNDAGDLHPARMSRPRASGGRRHRRSEEHGWASARAYLNARKRASILRQHPPDGVFADRASRRTTMPLDSIGDIRPECADQALEGKFTLDPTR